MRYEVPVLRRFAAKVVHDILPTALASVIGSVLFAQLHVGRAPESRASTTASVETMQLLRDEHGLMAKYLDAEVAREKAQAVSTEMAPPPAAVAIEPSAAPRPPVIAVAATKSPVPRGKPQIVSVSLPPPLVVAQAQQSDDAMPAGPREDSLVAKTIGLKDHVVAATHRVVSAIGGIPSWIGSIGDHLGGQSPTPRPPVDLISAS